MILHFLSQAGTVPLPDWSVLSQVTPGVAYAILGTTVVIVLAWVLGPPLRERLSRKPDPPPPPPSPSPSPAAALPQAVGTASETSAQFIEHLKQQLAAEEKDHAKTKAELETLRIEVSQLQQMLWRRGPQ